MIRKNRQYTPDEMRAVIAKAVTVTYKNQQSSEFMKEVVGMATALKSLPGLYKIEGSGKVDVLGVGQKKIRLDTNAVKSTQIDGITQRQIEYVVKKVYWDTWLDNDQTIENLSRQMNNRGLLEGKTANFELAVMTLIQEQFALDLQMLLFNGDKNYPAGGADKDFYQILDGFVKKAVASTNKLDLTTTPVTIANLAPLIKLLPQKYTSKLASRIKWYMNKATYDALVLDAMTRATNLGDTLLVNGELKKLLGYETVVVEGMEGPLVNQGDASAGRKGIVILTPDLNLVPVYGIGAGMIKYQREARGAEAIQRDASYHILRAHADAIIGEVDAIAYAIGTKL